MTPSRYWIARLGKTLGFPFQARRHSDIALESHLLRDAEVMLGAAIWEKTEHIEEISTPYWNLRKLHRKCDSLRQQMGEHETRIAKAHDERHQVLNAVCGDEQKLLDEKNELTSKLEQLSRKRDHIIEKAHEIRRQYEGCKTKREFLEESPDATASEIAKVVLQLATLKTRFNDLKQEREQIRAAMDEGEHRLDELALELTHKGKGRRESVSEVSQTIGEANREFTAIRAELGSMQPSFQQFYAEIGRFVSRNTTRNSECAKAARNHRSLIRIMAALRDSIIMNRKLVGLE